MFRAIAERIPHIAQMPDADAVHHEAIHAILVRIMELVVERLHSGHCLNSDALFGALHAYIEGFPVVVFATNGAVIHGTETLEGIRDGGTALNVACQYGINGQEFFASDWPYMLEAARQNFMQGKQPSPSFVEFVKAGAQ